MKEPTTTPNMKSLAGRRASDSVLVKEYEGSDTYRYAVYAIHTRFDAVTWVVKDSELTDLLTGESSVIRQCDTFQDAIASIA